MKKQYVISSDFVVDIRYCAEEEDATYAYVYPNVHLENGTAFSPSLVCKDDNGVLTNYGAHVIKESGDYFVEMVEMIQKKLYEERGCFVKTNNDVSHYIWNNNIIYTIFNVAEEYFITTSGINDMNYIMRLRPVYDEVVRDKIDYFIPVYMVDMDGIRMHTEHIGNILNIYR